MINTIMDQALGLRRLAKSAGVRVLPVFGAPERVPAIVNLATALARAGQRVLVLDTSRGEIAPAFGLCARYELKHVLEGEVAFRHAALATRDGVHVLPAARGIRMLAQARVSGLDFFESLAEKAAPVDLVIVNLDAGDSAAQFVPAHGESLLVLPRGPGAIALGTSCLAQLAARRTIARFRVLMMRSAFDEARQTVAALAQLADDKLNIEVVFGGNAPPHRHLDEAARVRRTIFDIDPAGPAARAFQNAATGVMDWDLALVAAAPMFAGHHTHAAVAGGAVTQFH